MTTQTATAPIDPIFINTPTGTVAVYGHEHVSTKLLQVVGTILSHDAFETVYHGVKSIIFRTDGYPKKGTNNVLATFSPDVGGIAINMVKTAERAIERSIDHPETSVLASWWIEMIMNFSHEIHHGVRWNTNGDELHNSEGKRMEEEERAEKYSETLLVDLAKEYDIEPAAMDDEVWFKNHIDEFLAKNNDAWAQKQNTMIEEKQLWTCKQENGKITTITSFKDLMCLLTNDNIEADVWNKPTIEVPTGVLTLDEQVNGKKAVMDTTGTMTEYVQEQLAPVVAPIEEVAFADNSDYDEYYDDIIEPVTNFSSPGEEMVAPVAPIIPVVVAPVEPEVHEDTTSENKTNMAEIGRIAQQVYTKMYNHIFTQCGPQQNSDVGFTNPEAVCSKPIQLTTEESAMFTSMNHLDMNGRWCTDIPTTNGLLGKVMKNTKLPAYEVNIRVNGQLHKRMLMPQNPAKTNATGQLTNRAVEARAGNNIAYVMNPSDNTANKWGPSIINGEYKLPRSN